MAQSELRRSKLSLTHSREIGREKKKEWVRKLNQSFAAIEALSDLRTGALKSDLGALISLVASVGSRECM